MMNEKTKKKNMNRFRHYDKMMRRKDPSTQAPPLSCRCCNYYQPDFKYRTCLYTECPYKKVEDVFRKKPLSKDSFS